MAAFLPSFLSRACPRLVLLAMSCHSQVLAFHAEYQVTSKHERRRAWAIVEFGQPLVPDEDTEVSSRASAVAVGGDGGGAGSGGRDGDSPPSGEMGIATRNTVLAMLGHVGSWECFGLVLLFVS